MGHDQVWIHQEECLIAMAAKKRPDKKHLRSLPPWRARMIAQIAFNCGLISAREFHDLEDEVKKVGGSGTLSLRK